MTTLEQLLEAFPGAVAVPEPLLDATDPEVIAWRDWNRSKPPITDWSKVRTIQKEKRLERKRRKKAAA